MRRTARRPAWNARIPPRTSSAIAAHVPASAVSVASASPSARANAPAMLEQRVPRAASRDRQAHARAAALRLEGRAVIAPDQHL